MAAPLQWGRNLIVAEGLALEELRASRHWLQWGRNLIVAEGISLTVSAFVITMLQWGRNLIVAEGRYVYKSVSTLTASMGPQLDSCGRDARLVQRA